MEIFLKFLIAVFALILLLMMGMTNHTFGVGPVPVVAIQTTSS